MKREIINELQPVDSRRPKNDLRLSKRVRKRLLQSPHIAGSVLVILIFSVVGLFAQYLTPFDPVSPRFGHQNLIPSWAAKPGYKSSPENILGTDWAGRDVLSRLMYATRTAFLLCLLSIPPAGIMGTVIGLTSGYLGGGWDDLLMRFTDIIHSFPSIMLVVLIVLALRNTPFGELLNGLLTLSLAFTLIIWVELSRLVRSAVLTLRELEYVEAAEGLGIPPTRIVFRHILPNCTSLIIIWLMAAVSRIIILEAVLGYLGIGITSAVEGSEFIITSWGGLFKDGRMLIHSNPVMLLSTAMCVILISVSFTFLGDYMRDQLDPRYRGLV